METPSYYSVIPANVRYNKKLRDKAKLLYGEITALSNKDGYCWAKNSYFADLYNVSNTTISTLIKNLVEQGYLESQIIYKENSKEIEKRLLKIVHTPIKENLNRYLKKVDEPIKENLKENNTRIIKEEEERENKNPFTFYENNFGLINSYIAMNINTYLDDGLTEELIIEAMKEAVDNNAKTWKYVKTILNNCLNENITTAEQYRAKQIEFKNKKANKTTTTNKQEVNYNTDFSEYDQYARRE